MNILPKTVRVEGLPHAIASIDIRTRASYLSKMPTQYRGYRDVSLRLLLVLLPFALAGDNVRSKKFMKSVKEKPGVLELPYGDGVYFKVIKRGHGFFRPQKDTEITTYAEYFDVARKPIPFAYQQSKEDFNRKKGLARNLLPGLRNSVRQMVEGDVWELYIPSKLAYGVAGHNIRPKVSPGEALIVRLELEKIVGETFEPSLRCNMRTKEWCTSYEIRYIDMLYDRRKNGTLDFFAMQEAQNLLDISQHEHFKISHPQTIEWVMRRSQLLSQAISLVTEHGEGTCTPGKKPPNMPVYFGYDVLNELSLHYGTHWYHIQTYEKWATLQSKKKDGG